MANIEQELLAFKNAKKGEDVRDSMISAIRKINTVNEEGVEEIEQKSDQMVEIVDSQIQIDEEPTQYTKLKLETTGQDIEVLTADELNEALEDTDIQAEMEGIRVPASGFEPQTPYTSAGQAVRGQVTALNEKIEGVEGKLSTDRELLDYTIVESINKWNPDKQVTDKFVNNETASLGELTDGSGYTTSGFIEAKKDDVLRWDYNNNVVTEGALLNRGTTVFRLAEYDANKTCLLVTANWATLPYTVQNNDTRYVRVSVVSKPTNSIIFGDSSTSQIHYIAYKKTADFYRISDIESDVADLQSNVLELETDVILPSTIYAVDGQQINIYKENLVLPKRLRTMPYLHTRLVESVQDDFRTIWTPTATVLRGANSDFELCYGNGETVKSFPIAYYIVPKDTGSSSINVLIIGDSKVQNGFVSYHFLHNFDDDNMSVTLLGTKYIWDTTNRHEGYGSRTAKWFCTDSSSPFYNNGSFDFANYLSTNNIATPDFVFINLGTNDCASLAGNTDTFITEFITYITQMIDSIHSVSSDIHVIVGLCEGCATTLDNNASAFINWDLNRKISMLHKATIEAFDRRTSERIWVCPMYMGMDLTQDYAMKTLPLSQRDADANSGTGNGKTRMQITDRVHQNEVGYWKNADYMYAIVKYIVAKNQ